MKIMITKRIAEAMLEKCHPSHPHLSLKKVYIYAKSLGKNPQWGLKHLPRVEVDRDGYLVNGRHHLVAIIYSGKMSYAYMDLCAGEI